MLVRELEKQIEEMEPPPSNLRVCDCRWLFLFEYFQRNASKFCGCVKKKNLQCLVKKSSSREAIVFNRFFTPLIKDGEHTFRGCVVDKDCYISGPQQTRTADFVTDLKDFKFKEALFKFFTDHGADQEMATIIGNKTIDLSYNFCYVYSVPTIN